jgi:lipoprotein LprG
MRRHLLRSLLVPAAVVLAGSGLVACTEEGGGGGDDARTAEEVLAQARETLDSTSGLRITLVTEDLPDGVLGVTTAEGVATHEPELAFDGQITVPLAGSEFEVPVVSVGGDVYAQIPLTPGWSDVDPAEYGAPDPATLLDTEDGFSALLTATEDVEAGEGVRGGEGNRDVLTEYTGTVPGDVVANVIPSAEGEFEVTYTVTEEDELRGAVLTGVFYPDSEEMTYTLGFDDYGLEQEITAP